jgi:signal transduction histidine kinase/CRP-like cAMP-binding protein
MGTKSSLDDKIKANVLFQSMEETLLPLWGTMGVLREHNYSDGKVIFEDGSEGNSLYLVVSGSVKISKSLKTGDEVIFGILHEGDFFGEIDLVDRRNRSARATAVGNCTLVRIGKTEFDTLLEKSPSFALNLIRMLTLRLRSNNLTYVQNQESNLTTLRQQLTKTHRLIEASKVVNSTLDLDTLLELIFQTAAQTVSADRGTLFLIDETQKILWSKTQKGNTKVEIQLPVGTGIAGTVAATGEIINIPDAYADPRFNPKVDQSSGYRTVSILCMPMKNRTGAIIGVFQLLNKTEGTFSKEDEEFIEAFSVHAALAIENARLVQNMVQHERLSAVGSMASTIVHDIKNPLGIIRLSAEVIRKRTEDHETKSIADEIIRQVDHFISMAREILDYARGVGATNFCEFDFGDLIDTVFTGCMRDLERRKIQVIKHIAFTGLVRVDPDKLVRVFYNIVGNAADAMPKGGTITITAAQSGNNVVVEFHDNGEGMDSETKARIFEPFFTQGKKHGTGLGMAIVKKIIDDHEGTIEIESSSGKGTTIKLTIPIGLTKDAVSH